VPRLLDIFLSLGILVIADPGFAATNSPPKRGDTKPTVTNLSDPVEKEYLKLLADDDAAQRDADRWINDNKKFEEQGAGVTQATLKLRILQRLEPVGEAYEEFLKRHPDHARARLAYGSFLGDIGKEDEAMQQWEKARELDPKNPAVWNNLANYYGHSGPVIKAFEYYEKAIALNPHESVYFQNFATTVYLFRLDATNYFKIDESKVFDKALDLYRRALQLDPKNFPLATDLAQSYYGIKPMRFDEAMAAWRAAENIANDTIEREGIYLHYARLQINAGKFDDARKNLNAVTNGLYNVVKNRLLKKLGEEEGKARETNAPPVAVERK
jgi:tetratricopeptide (TPR) repeat protein